MSAPNQTGPGPVDPLLPGEFPPASEAENGSIGNLRGREVSFASAADWAAPPSIRAPLPSGYSGDVSTLQTSHSTEIVEQVLSIGSSPTSPPERPTPPTAMQILQERTRQVAGTGNSSIVDPLAVADKEEQPPSSNPPGV